MASKKSNLARQREANKKKYLKECKNLRWFYIAAAAVTLAILALFFLKWIYIYNSDGYKDSDTGKMLYTEVKVSGWSFFLATLSGQFSGKAAVLGDIAVPFYYYAKGYVIAIGVFTVLAVLCLIASVALNVVAVFGRQKLSFAAACVETAAFVMLLAAMIAAYAANGSQILPVYCSGNSACSVRTLIYIPLVLSLAVMVTGIVAAVRYSRAKALLKI